MSVELELLEHLKKPDSIEYLRQQGFAPEIISDTEIRSFAQWVFFYIRKHGKVPSFSVMREEWDDLPEPKTELDVEYVYEQMKAKHLRNEQRRIIEKMAEADPDDFLSTMTSESQKLWKTVAPIKYVSSTEDYQEILSAMKERAKIKEVGASYGFPEIDEWTGGCRKGHLAFTAARPKRYKTWKLLNGFVQQRRQGFTPVLFSYELSIEEMNQRLACLVSGVSYNRMVRHRLMANEWKQIEQAMEKFKNLGPAYIVAPPYDQRNVDAMVLEAQRLEADSVLIDQFNYIQPPPGKYYRSDEASRAVVHEMKAAAVKMNIGWHCLCQLNREAAGLEDLQDAAHMIGLTRAIEETADILFGLQRSKEDEEMNIVRMVIMEARACPKDAHWDIKVELNDRTEFRLI